MPIENVEGIPQGGTRSIHDRGGPMYISGLKIFILGIFLGQEICHIFFLGLKKYAYFLDLHISEQNFCCNHGIRKLFIQTWSTREDEETLTDIPISLAY